MNKDLKKKKRLLYKRNNKDEINNKRKNKI